MTTSRLRLSARCVYTCIDPDRIRLANRGEVPSLPVTEEKRWATALNLLQQARAESEELPIIFSHASGTNTLTYWALLRDIRLDGARTHFTFSALRLLEGHLKTELLVVSTGEPLPENHIRPYVLIHTPAFLLRPAASWQAVPPLAPVRVLPGVRNLPRAKQQQLNRFLVDASELERSLMTEPRARDLAELLGELRVRLEHAQRGTPLPEAADVSGPHRPEAEASGPPEVPPTMGESAPHQPERGPELPPGQTGPAAPAGSPPTNASQAVAPNSRWRMYWLKYESGTISADPLVLFERTDIEAEPEAVEYRLWCAGMFEDTVWVLLPDPFWEDGHIEVIFDRTEFVGVPRTLSLEKPRRSRLGSSLRLSGDGPESASRFVVHDIQEMTGADVRAWEAQRN